MLRGRRWLLRLVRATAWLARVVGSQVRRVVARAARFVGKMSAVRVDLPRTPPPADTTYLLQSRYGDIWSKDHIIFSLAEYNAYCAKRVRKPKNLEVCGGAARCTMVCCQTVCGTTMNWLLQCLAAAAASS